MPYVFYDSVEVHIHDERTIEAQIVQKLKNNEPRPKFTGSYKKKACSSFQVSGTLWGKEKKSRKST